MTQRANASKQVRTKAARLRVVDLTDRLAFVEGEHNTYQIWMNGLACSCPAGCGGLHCSHVMAAIRQRAMERQCASVAFCHSERHAASFAAMWRARGRDAQAVSEYGWHYVQYNPVRVPQTRTLPTVAELEAITGAWLTEARSSPEDGPHAHSRPPGHTGARS